MAAGLEATRWAAFAEQARARRGLDLGAAGRAECVSAATHAVRRFPNHPLHCLLVPWRVAVPAPVQIGQGISASPFRGPRAVRRRSSCTEGKGLRSMPLCARHTHQGVRVHEQRGCPEDEDFDIRVLSRAASEPVAKGARSILRFWRVIRKPDNHLLGEENRLLIKSRETRLGFKQSRC
jgi:hypothetical protein